MYLVVHSNQLSYSIKSTRSREFTGTRHGLEVEQLLCLFLCQSTSLRLFLCFFHDLPNVPQDGPMSYRYARIITFLLVYIVVLTNMETAGGIPSFV